MIQNLIQSIKKNIRFQIFKEVFNKNVMKLYKF